MVDENTVLTPYSINNLELLIDKSTGAVFTSQRGLSRLCGKAPSTIKHWILVESISNHEFKARYSKGLKLIEAYNETTIALALEKYNPRLLIQCQKAGLRVFLHGLVGISYEAVVKPTANQPSAKPKALAAAEYTKQIMDLLATDNPRLAQYLVDHCLNEVIGSQLPQSKEKTLSPSYYVPPYLGVVELAEKLGYSVDISSRSSLGKFVKARAGHLAKQEKRLCNGRMTDIYVYPECYTVCEAVVDFFK